MMKQILIFLFLNFAVLTLLANAQEDDFYTHIDKLLAKGAEERQACRDFSQRWEKISLGQIHAQSPSHAFKEQALEVLHLMKTRPDVSPFNREALNYFRANYEPLAKNHEDVPLLTRLGKINASCEPIIAMAQLPLLLRDTKSFDLERPDIEAIRSEAAKFIQGGRPFTSFISAALPAVVLEEYLKSAYSGQDREALLQKTQNYLNDFERRRKLLDEFRKKVSPTKERNRFEYLEYEWKLTDELSKNFSELLEGIKFN